MRSAFEERAACVSQIYSQFEVLPGVYINGNLTLGENIADIGGVHSTYTAYQQVLYQLLLAHNSLAHSSTCC